MLHEKAYEYETTRQEMLVQALNNKSFTVERSHVILGWFWTISDMTRLINGWQGLNIAADEEI